MGLPTISGEKVYSVKWACMIIAPIVQFFAQLGPFYGIFFGQRGPNDEWPYAWWSFCFFGNAFTMAFLTLNYTRAKVVRTQDGFTFYNLSGKELSKLPLSEVLSMEVKSGCAGEYIALETSDKNYEERKKAAGCCACCQCKSVTISVIDMVAFKEDHGFTAGKTLQWL